MSEQRDYPGFGMKILTFILFFGGLGIVSVVLCFYFNNKGSNNLTYIFVILFAFFVSVGLGGGLLKIYKVSCHACGGKTRTIKNTEADVWQAYCSNCDILWNLGIGTNTD